MSQQIASDWAIRVIDSWKDRMSMLGVHDPYSSGKNFAYFVHAAAGGNVSRIEFAYNYYLKFTDMGVGKGTTLGTKNSNRISKPWSGNFLLEIKKLANMLALSNAEKAAIIVSQNISDNAKTEING